MEFALKKYMNRVFSPGPMRLKSDPHNVSDQPGRRPAVKTGFAPICPRISCGSASPPRVMLRVWEPILACRPTPTLQVPEIPTFMSQTLLGQFLTHSTEMGLGLTRHIELELNPTQPAKWDGRRPKWVFKKARCLNAVPLLLRGGRRRTFWLWMYTAAYISVFCFAGTLYGPWMSGTRGRGRLDEVRRNS